MTYLSLLLSLAKVSETSFVNRFDERVSSLIICNVPNLNVNTRDGHEPQNHEPEPKNESRTFPNFPKYHEIFVFFINVRDSSES